MRVEPGNSNMRRFWIHYFALLLEIIGTFFVSIDLIRIDLLASSAGNAGYGGEPAKYHGWIWHSGGIGSCLLLFGIVVVGFALALEHRELLAVRRRPK